MQKHQLKPNTIYCGDNLKMLSDIPDESVDLIYIDPPFNSNRNYEVFWGDTGEKRAFEDRHGDVQAYIDYMRPRVLELYRVLKKTGSFYYHCDWHASHYVKIMLDQIFNFNNFQNEIIWTYRRWPAKSKSFQRMHDTILFYVKDSKSNYVFNKVYQPLADITLKIHKGKKQIATFIDGKRLSKDQEEKSIGTPIPDYWYIPAIAGNAKERLGYPTQKPTPLLERIIEVSSNKGDIILDAFCGCGTTLVAAQKLGRKWIGIDISPTACRVMAQRLWDIFKLKEGKDFELTDLPKTEEQLRKLPPFEFQNWACVALGAIPNRVKVGDYGIDGKLYPIEQERKKTDEKGLFGDIDIYYPIQVKQKDKAGRPDMDSFETAMRRDGRKRGYFISFDFTDDAIREIKRLDKEGEIEIIPITVKELLKKEQIN